MNHRLRNTIAIISVVFLQILPLFSQASPSMQRNETDTMANESYITDWHVDHGNSTSAALEPCPGSNGRSLADNVPS